MIQRTLKRVAKRLGYDVSRSRGDALPRDMGEEFAALYHRYRDYSKTSVERMYALYEATRYVIRTGVPGDIVECGVWRGGSSMLAAGTILAQGSERRRLWMYDTYEGMSEPTEHDRDKHGNAAADLMRAGASDKETSVWCLASLEDVRANMAITKYPPDEIRYVQGKVEDTIPGTAPDQIALLRLDTDFYESTLHELVHLYPRLAPGAVLIIDDYGHWEGARKATDEFFATLARPPLLQRIDYTGRLAVVPGA